VTGEIDSKGLRRDERVRVRDPEEVLRTLDASGRLDGLPFMPEMLQFAGRELTVFKRADKTCDTIMKTGVRRMYDTVHLNGVRCDGSAHGGCQAACLIHWREAWLERIPEDDMRSGPPPDNPSAGAADCTIEDVNAATRRPAVNGEERYRCQATELREASLPMAWWDLRQYYRDVKTRNARPSVVIRGFLIGLFNKMQGFNRRWFPQHHLIRGGARYPFLGGVLTKTPEARLDLASGELVEIKSKQEIFATLDKSHRNRGMLFDFEMLKYCGQRARVRSRVRQIIDEVTGEMLYMKSPCIILDEVYCTADYHHFCPRAIFPYWREIWLRRVKEPKEDDAYSGSGN